MAAITLGVVLGGSPSLFALNPSLDMSQYGHTAWTTRDGFSLGNIYAMAQTPDGYMWLASEFGLFRFDGVRSVLWHPPGGERQDLTLSLLAARDGTLWIGTGSGLESWSGGKLTQQLAGVGVTSLIEDHKGTVWAGTWSERAVPARLCAIRGGNLQCYGGDGSFGKVVSPLYEDSSGSLWAGSESGLWHWNPGPPRLYSTTVQNLAAISESADGRVLFAAYGTGLMQLAGTNVHPYPIRCAGDTKRLLPNSEVNANQMLRDRNGGLWIATVERGLIHVHNGRTDTFTRADGLSGDVVLRLFEDREGSVWVTTTGGLDRFSELPITTVSTKQGLPSDATNSVLAATDGSIWIGTHAGLARFKDGRATNFRKGTGLPGDTVQSLFQDDRGRIWGTFSGKGLAEWDGHQFVIVPGLPSEEVYSITGDKEGNLWLSGNRGLSHFREGRLVEHFPWSVMGRQQQAKVIVADKGGVWLSFWNDGGVLYLKDGRIRMSYSATNGLGKGHVPGLRLDAGGALWAATEEGGLSRIKNGRITTLTTSNGLPSDTIHWSMEDKDHFLWLYTARGLVRIPPAEVDAWIADPTHRVQSRVWDAFDGVRLRANAASSFGPTVAESTEGKLWFLTGEGVQVIDPLHVIGNPIPPPVHIEKIVADYKTYWENSPDAAVTEVRLPALTRDLQIDFTALSLVAPEKIHFRYKLEGQDRDWRDAPNVRAVQYSNLPPRSYRFRVIACNNSGVWNEQGDLLEFTIAPAYYQTNWFRALCAIFLLALVWAMHRLRVRQLHRKFALTLDARVAERTSIARELHDTLLQSFHGLLLRFQIVSELLPERPVEAKEQLDGTIARAAAAVTEGRDAVQGLRASTVQTNDLASAINTLGEELAADPANRRVPEFQVTVEGHPRDLHPILRDEIYRISAEALRNSFQHAVADRVEVEIRYDDQEFRLRVRDDGKGIDALVLSGTGREGHYGIAGMRERAKVIGGTLTVWSQVDAGTEVELRIPAAKAYATASKHSRVAEILARK